MDITSISFIFTRQLSRKAFAFPIPIETISVVPFPQSDMEIKVVNSLKRDGLVPETQVLTKSTLGGRLIYLLPHIEEA